MRIGLRGGHSKNAMGAIGIRNEYKCMQELYRYTKKVLEEYGHTVVNCNSDAASENGELSEGACKANIENVDYFISLHMNCFNGTAHGTEAYVYNSNSRAKCIAERLVNNFEGLGLYNRGVKYSDKYYEMRNVKAPNIIFETLFCDSERDISIWSPTPYEKMAHLIANAIDTNIPKEIGSLEEKDEETIQEREGVYYRVIAGSYSKKENAEKLVNDLKNKGYDVFIDRYEK